MFLRFIYFTVTEWTVGVLIKKRLKAKPRVFFQLLLYYKLFSLQKKKKGFLIFQLARLGSHGGVKAKGSMWRWITEAESQDRLGRHWGQSGASYYTKMSFPQPAEPCGRPHCLWRMLFWQMGSCCASIFGPDVLCWLLPWRHWVSVFNLFSISPYVVLAHMTPEQHACRGSNAAGKCCFGAEESTPTKLSEVLPITET